MIKGMIILSQKLVGLCFATLVKTYSSFKTNVTKVCEANLFYTEDKTHFIHYNHSALFTKIHIFTSFTLRYK